MPGGCAFFVLFPQVEHSAIPNRSPCRYASKHILSFCSIIQSVYSSAIWNRSDVSWLANCALGQHVVCLLLYIFRRLDRILRDSSFRSISFRWCPSWHSPLFVWFLSIHPCTVLLFSELYNHQSRENRSIEYQGIRKGWESCTFWLPLGGKLATQLTDEGGTAQ